MVNPLRSLSIRAQLITLSVISAIGFSVLIAVNISTQLEEARRQELRSLVESAIAVAAQLEKQVEKGTLSRDEAQTQAKTQISMMRYRGNEYFFVTDMSPKMIMHPIRPELDGKDLSTNKDPTGKALFLEFVQRVRDSGGGFVDYMWPRPGADKPISKLSYVHGYAPWGWIIGTGVYTDDLSQLVWRTIRSMLLKVGGIVVFILAATVVLIRSITQPLGALSGVMSRSSGHRSAGRAWRDGARCRGAARKWA